MSGVIIINTNDKFDVKPKFSVKAFTDNHGISAASHNTYSGEVFVSSAVPGYDKLGLVLASRTYTTDGYIFGYIYPEYVNSNGLDKSGTPKKVPMQYLDTQFNFGKLVWRPGSSINAAFGGYVASTNQGVYNHYFKYNPYGTPQVQLDDYLAYFKLKYAINNKSYINLKLSNYHREFLSEVYDDPALYELRSEISTNEFSVAGEDYVRFSTLFDRIESGVDYVIQLDRIQNISAGFTYNQLKTNLERRNPNGNASLENYKYKPIEMHGYLKDKLEFEDMGMLDSVASFIEAGQIKVFTVESLDGQSWTNGWAHPADRARRHQDYDRYIVEEVAPFMRRHCGDTQEKFLTTGVSMGAYHAANFFFRHPDIFDTVIALSGLYRLDHFIGDYMDDNVYFNTPLAYLPSLTDPWYLDQYKQSKIIVCVGQGAWEDEMLADTRALKDILEQKGIPHWVDIWGYDVNHDWPWWRKMLPYFLDKLQLPAYAG